MRTRRGSAYIFAVVVMAVLTLILASAAARVRTEATAQRTQLEEQRAEWMAHAAIARGMAALQTLAPEATTQNDEWLTLGQTGAEEFGVGTDRFRVQVVDAGSLINLNTAPEEHLLNLPITQEQADSLLDWREAGQTPRVSGGKDEFYNNLARPYNTALRRLNTLSEVLAVRGWDGPTLYDPPGDRNVSTNGLEYTRPLDMLATVDSASPNTGPDDQQRLNVNQVQAQQMVQRGLRQQAAQAIVNRRNQQGQFASMRAVLETPGLNNDDFAAILDNLAIGAAAEVTGRINLNTATEEVLRSVPGVTPDVASTIVGRQGTLASLGELASLPGVTAQNIPQLADAFTVGSTVFLIRAMGVSGSGRAFLQAVVRVENAQAKLVRVERLPFGDLRERWEWPEDAATTTSLVDE